MTCRHSHTPQVQVTLGALCWTVILHLWHARRHKTSHKERKEKKNLVGTGGSFLLSHQRKHTKENSAPFSHHENTRHLNVSGPSLYWDWCETTFPLRCTIRWERGVHVDRHPLRGPSVWGELQSSGPSAPWRRWISYRRRCQHRPITNQTHTHTHLHRGKRDNKDLVGNDVQQNIVSSLFSYIISGGFTETDLQQDVKSSHPDPFQFMMQVLTHKRGSQVNKKWHNDVWR